MTLADPYGNATAPVLMAMTMTVMAVIVISK